MRRLLGTSGLAVGALALAGCWPVPGADADRSSHNPWEETLTTGSVGDLTEQWRWTDPSGPITSPVLSNGRVHVGGRCIVSTLNQVTGAVAWQDLVGDPAELGCAETHAVGSSEPYVFDSPDGQRVQVSAGMTLARPPTSFYWAFYTRDFDVASGVAADPTEGLLVARRGSLDVRSWVEPAAPAAARNQLAVGGRQFLFHASTHGGAPWPATAFTLGGDSLFHAGYAVLATEPGTATFGHGVRAYDVDTARPGCGPATVGVPPAETQIDVECPVWATPTDGTPTIPVLSADGATLYTRTTAGTLYALDAATGAVQWTATGLGAAGAPALAQGTLFVPTGTGEVLLFEADGCSAAACPPASPDGFDTGSGAPVTHVSVAGDVVYASSAGNVYASGECSPGEGCPVEWSGPGSGPPVVSQGRLYVTDGESTLIAYGLG